MSNQMDDLVDGQNIQEETHTKYFDFGLELKHICK